MNIIQERSNQIYNFICESTLPATRSDIARHLGFRVSPPSPYLIKLIEGLVEDGLVEKMPCTTVKKRLAWGYVRKY